MSMTPGAPVQTQGPMPNTFGPYQQGGNVFTQSANALTSATNAAQGAANYNPTTVTAPTTTAATYNPATAATSTYNPATAQTATVAGTSLDPYMNPYTQAVTDQTMQQLAEQQQMALNDVGAQATAASAFGGSRQGVVEVETYDAYAQAQAQALADLNNQNYAQAQAAAMYDTSAQNSTNQFNANSQNTAGQFNSNAMNTGNQFNANSANTAGQFNTNAMNTNNQFNANNSLAAQVANQNAGLQGAGLNLNAAGQLGALSQTGFDQGNAIIGQQSSQGALMQGINQMLIDAAKGQYAGFTGAPNTSLQQLLSATGVPTGSSTTQTQTPGLFDYLTLGLNAIAPGA